ncbi:hypothetical protein COF68_06345 [Bacillus toyonensis]|uniref:hypothetical protein n=1 Tax=Bacillus toyonensis TaxID=155322 RepID=UPI000BFB8D6B|nr:hypothetical protein [Bacillus toyonensis]PHE64454.1 hypothetical protein COF68_06345 [Bacillus toyonensis]
MQKVELYFNVETGEWMIKHKDSTVEYALEGLIEEHECDNVSIEFTGFKGKQEEEDKVTVEEDEFENLKLEDYKEVTGDEAVRQILLGHKLFDLKLESYLQNVETGKKYESIIAWRDFDGLSVKPKDLEITQGYVAKNVWLMEDTSKNTEIRYNGCKVVTGDEAEKHLLAGDKLWVKHLDEYLIYKKVKGVMQIMYCNLDDGDGVLCHTRLTIDGVKEDKWLIKDKTRRGM